MKKHNWKLYSVIVLGMMVTTSVVVHAEDDGKIVAETKGKVTFKQDTGGGPVIVDPTNPENPGVIDPGDGENGSTGNGNKSFNINWVSKFKFEDILITGREMTQYASPATLAFLQPEDEDAEEILPKDNLPNFIQVTDNRGTNTGWNVTASASEFKQEGSEDKVLKGAKLLLTNPHIFSQGSSEELSPTVHAKSVDLLVNPGSPIHIMKAATEKGQGTWSLAWSPKEKGQDFEFSYNDKEDKGVQLVVPVTALPEVDKSYVSEIQWNLSDTPNN